MILAVIFYGPLQSIPKIMSKAISPIHSLLSNKYWIDEAYEAIVVAPLRRTANWFFTGIDRATVDSAVNGIGALTLVKAEILRHLQTGRIGHYALMMFGSLSILIFFGLLIK
jgi:NADH-quinone oxidoreductase subunit L